MRTPRCMARTLLLNLGRNGSNTKCCYFVVVLSHRRCGWLVHCVIVQTVIVVIGY